jgi:hypothetical protein
LNILEPFQHNRNGKEGINVIMTCYKAKYSGTLKANSEIDELKWLNHKDLDIISEVDKRYSPF